MSDYSVHIVIDNGTSTCKAGFNGENAPRAVIPTVIGNTKNPVINILDDGSKFYIGREAIYNSTSLELENPIEDGKIKNFDKMEKIWSHIFYNELKVKPEAHNVFMTENLYSSNQEREKIAEIIFEKFSIFNIHIEPQPVMTLYSTTKTSGLIVESGESITQIVPIYEGFILPQAIKSNNLAGEKMTKLLGQFLSQDLKKHNVVNGFYTCKNIKEQFLEISLEDNFNLVSDTSVPREFTKSSKDGQEEFKLPDGNKIVIKQEKYLVPETIFSPNLANLDIPSIQKLLWDSVLSVDIHLRKDFLSNIILGGGNTMIKNFPERLKKELLKNFKDNDDNSNFVKINAQNERIYSAWIGASVVCSISNFQQMWISKNDYEEVGPNIIHKKYYL